VEETPKESSTYIRGDYRRAGFPSTLPVSNLMKEAWQAQFPEMIA
jgi:hypothetical protein